MSSSPKKSCRHDTWKQRRTNEFSDCFVHILYYPSQSDTYTDGSCQEQWQLSTVQGLNALLKGTSTICRGKGEAQWQFTSWVCRFLSDNSLDRCLVSFILGYSYILIHIYTAQCTRPLHSNALTYITRVVLHPQTSLFGEREWFVRAHLPSIHFF